jgi:UDP-glucose 4-epimerase
MDDSRTEAVSLASPGITEDKHMNLQESRIVVIGGAGFIGSHIVDQLLLEHPAEILVFDNLVRGSRQNLSRALTSPKVRLIQGTITDVAGLRATMSGADYVFHLAALWLGECVHDPRNAVEVNVVGTYNVIEACRDLKIKRLVFSSSASVYGNALAVPMTEEHPFNNRTMYGATKIAGEQFCRAFNDMHRLPYAGLRYMNVYGPRMDYKGTYVSVIMKVLDRIEQGLAPVIHGDGSQAYDFVHVEDVARANVLAMKASVSDEFFNVGMGTKTTINELVGKLLKLTGSPLKPEYHPQEHIFVTHRLGSIEKAEKLLGFRAQVPLDAGLRSVVEWRRTDQQRCLRQSA